MLLCCHINKHKWLIYHYLCRNNCPVLPQLLDAMEISEKGLWGNYSIPSDNPFVDVKDVKPEIWALGFRNPWRCSFDSERPSYFLCGDCGQV